MNLLRARRVTLATAVVLSLGIVAHASTVITAVGSSVVANGGQAPGSALNYDLFGFQGSPASVLTNFSVSTGSAPVFASGSCCNYSQLIAPGGSSAFYTGIDYSVNLAATFSPLSDGSFTVWVLDANGDGNALGNSSISLSVNGGAQVTIASNFIANTNEFSEFLITGATAGDVFQVFANTTGPRPSVGGLLFGPGAPPVPEPGSFVLLGTGVLGVFGAARRKIFKA